MTTVKMPRAHTMSFKRIRRGYGFWYGLTDILVTLGGMLLFVLCLWIATVTYDWWCKFYIEHQTLKIELQQEKQAFKAMFVQDAMDKKRKDNERKQAIKNLCERDERGCNIILMK